jgi:hypothetical protein
MLLGAAFLAAVLQPNPGLAQGTAFTYQGRLEAGSQPYTGWAEFQPTLWDAASGGTQVAVNTPAQVVVSVTNGLFVLPLDFGTNFPGADRWLQLEVRTNIGPFTLLTPRQKLTPTPYAITASSLSGRLQASQLTGTLPSTNLAGTYSGAVTFNNPANSFSGNGAGLTGLNAGALSSGTVPDSRLAPNVARTNQVWLLSGNAGTTPRGHFLGTTDDQPLELRVNGQRALRLEPTGSNSVNVVGGWSGNFVAPGVVGATIAGGGAGNYWGVARTNSVHSNFGVVAGGWGNIIRTNGTFSVISGGRENTIAADAFDAVIAGGWKNAIGSNSYSSAIGGGRGNTIAANSWSAVVAGGDSNAVGTNSYSSVIGGGFDNDIAANSGHATIAGGSHNAIGTNCYFSTIGGGRDNTIAANSGYATVAGGDSNAVGTNSYSSAIGGGYKNTIAANAWYATIAGGCYNAIASDSDCSVIGGGYKNTIAANAWYATIAGGYINAISTNSYSSAIVGGTSNKIAAYSSYATIAGGLYNAVGASANYSAIGGGCANTIATNSECAAIAGGYQNTIGTASFYSSIDGGYSNSIGADSGCATVAGGWLNAIGTNSDFSTIGGGGRNTIADNALYATIPGGSQNFATNYAFAGGRRAKARHTGAFVWGDSTDADITSVAPDSVTLRASGGYRLFSNSNATTGVALPTGARSWYTFSDRNGKENFGPVDVDTVLAKVVALPIATWNYKSQDPGIRHMGPTAQDFKAAFGLGESDTGIATIDADGVALAAIQGLNRKLEAQSSKLEARSAELEVRSRELEQKNAALERQVAELKALVQALADKVNGGGQ